MRDIQTKVLTLEGGPVLLHQHLIEAVREAETRGMAERVQLCVTGPGDLLALGRLAVSFLIIGHGILQK